MDKSYKKFLVPGIYVLVAISLMVSVFMIISGVNNYIKGEGDYKYTLDNVFKRDIPVVNIENNDGSIIRPYIAENIEIGKYFYDVKADNKSQESSIVYYENTYIQNNGVDYVSNEKFDVVSVLDGEVISVEESEIYNKIITVKHTDNLITVYSSVEDVLVNKGYKVSQGEIIASSAKNTLNDKEATLHFEVYYKSDVIDPENIYSLSIKDFR